MKNYEGCWISKEKSIYNSTSYHVLLGSINGNERLFGIVCILEGGVRGWIEDSLTN